MHEYKRPYRSTKQLGTLLASITRKAFGRTGFSEQQLFVHWRDIVGTKLARCSMPIRLTRGRNNKGGTLRILAESGFALLLQHDAPRIIERINKDSGYELVAKLEFVQAPLPEAPAFTDPPAAEQSGPAPLAKPLLVPDIDHPCLREALQGLADSLNPAPKALKGQKKTL